MIAIRLDIVLRERLLILSTGRRRIAAKQTTGRANPG
jgi:hypothetical protein